MRIPVIHGVIDRRILANYQVDPDVLAKILPPPFQPKLVNGIGVAGICLIRLRHIKPRFLAGNFGLSSENAAHRIAVEWVVNDVRHEGVYIPRRDTSSNLNALVGGRLFPGVHHRSKFEVVERNDYYRIELSSMDDSTHVLVEGRLSTELPTTSIFGTLQEVSDFFLKGSLGYSVTRRSGEYDGLELRSLHWKVEPLTVERISSTFFENEHLFPKGSLKFDCALIMRGVQHEWHGRETLCSPIAT